MTLASKLPRIGMLRPVGEMVPVTGRAGGRMEWPTGYTAHWVDSGTSALGVALRAVLSRRGPGPHRVAIPAYTCPDLISAVLWAGAQPVVVDTLPGTPWLDPKYLARERIGTLAAVVAPHFLGIPHPLDDILAESQKGDFDVVEDAAQSNVRSETFRPSAGLVVLSFGRGKPIPVGGGVLLCSEDWRAEVEQIADTLPVGGGSVTAWRLKALAQNLAMSRIGYAIARCIPDLRIGETRFSPLKAPKRMRPELAAFREGLLADWRTSPIEMQQAIRLLAQATPGLVDLATELGWDGARPLLRYPVLATDPDMTSRLLSQARAAGVEASAFYGGTVNRALDVPTVDCAERLVNAADFARRLVTLPAHTGLDRKDLQMLQRTLD